MDLLSWNVGPSIGLSLPADKALPCSPDLH